MKDEMTRRTDVPTYLILLSLVWAAIAGVWMQGLAPAVASGISLTLFFLALPLAWLLAKALGVSWKSEANALYLMPWFLSPLLFWAFGAMPIRFLMIQAVITGAHLFPFGKVFGSRWVAVGAGVIAFGAWWWGGTLSYFDQWKLAAGVSATLFVLAVLVGRGKG